MNTEDLITDVDLTKRKENEWEDIYHVKITDGEIDVGDMNEFEFAYKLTKSKYYLQPAKQSKNKDLDYDVAEQMEMRAMKIVRDIFSNADRIEKEQLEQRYIATKYILDYSVK